MSTGLEITLVICGTIIVLYIMSTIDDAVRRKQRLKYRRNKSEDAARE